MIWFLGDTSVLPAVENYAGDEELLVSATENAIPEEVWAGQVHDARGKKWKEPIKVILFLTQRDYDSELALSYIFSKSPPNSSVILICYQDDFAVQDGAEHFQGKDITLIRIDSINNLLLASYLKKAFLYERD